MLISKKWLEDFVELGNKLTAEEIGHDLTMKTVEVESVINLAQNLDKVVIGVITKVESHPNADSLKVCQVNAGNKHGELQIVCGGVNLSENMKVALALVGAKVHWHGEEELVELGPVKLRGVESNGMICGSDEIGLSMMFPKSEEKEILVLSAVDAKAGTSLSSALGIDDIVYDIDNKSMTHRSDLWGHYGVARELSAFYNKKLKTLNPSNIKSGSDIKLEVEVKNKELCPRYLGVVVSNIKIEPSPMWMQNKLRAIGVRTINNVVDVTNYVMHELGQPMHAFDARYILNKNGKDNNKKIIVRTANKNESFKALDGKDYTLSNTDLVIADEKKTVALAGIKGGENSEIKPDTSVIILESANFQAVSVRRTSTRLGLRTDSSMRFEKSLDPELAELGLKRAVELLKKILPQAKVASSVVGVNGKKAKASTIKLSETELTSKLGFEISKTDVLRNLKSLGFSATFSKGYFAVVPPSFRAVKDITIKEDVIEEIVRLYGYDKIPSSLPSMPIIPPQKNKSRIVERLLKNYLSQEFGFCETYNYSFVSPTMIDNLGEDKSKYIELDNPIASDRSYLRRSLLLNLLQNTESNLHRFDSVKLFEIGKTYIAEKDGAPAKKGPNKSLPYQGIKLGAVYSAKNNHNPFFVLSEAIQNTLQKIGLTKVEFSAGAQMADFLHPGRTAKIKSNGCELGFVGELSPVVQEKIGIPYRVVVCEIGIENILKCIEDKSEYTPLSHFPSVERDIAFVVDKKIKHEQIYEMISKSHQLIESCELFDIYESEKIGKDKKSMAYHITYRSEDKTLEAKVVDEINNQILDNLQNNFGADIRK